MVIWQNAGKETAHMAIVSDREVMSLFIESKRLVCANLTIWADESKSSNPIASISKVEGFSKHIKNGPCFS